MHASNKNLIFDSLDFILVSGLICFYTLLKVCLLSLFIWNDRDHFDIRWLRLINDWWINTLGTRIFKGFEVLEWLIKLIILKTILFGFVVFNCWINFIQFLSVMNWRSGRYRGKRTERWFLFGIGVLSNFYFFNVDLLR